MNDPAATIEVDLRIPGQWSGPRELVERLPRECRLTPEALVLPGGARITFGAMDADDQFAQIFHSSCRRPPTAVEQAAVDNYAVNVF